MRAIGGVLLLIAVAILWNEVKPAQLARSYDPSFGLGAKFASGIGGLVGVWLFRLGRRIGAKRATQGLTDDRRPPMLLLRSFEQDEIRIPKPRPKRENSFEELFYSMLPFSDDDNTLENIIVDEFQTMGPVVAIGVPGQSIAPTGAARTWFPHTDWKDRVEDLTSWSQRVIMVVGDLEKAGLAWEANYLFTSLPPQKLLLLFPPHVKEPENERRWELLRTITGNRLPSYRPGTIALYFPGPDRLVRISVGVPLAIKYHLEDLAAIYESAILKARDCVEAPQRAAGDSPPPTPGTVGPRAEEFPWGAQDPA